MFSKACEYALRATIYLAQKSSEERKLGVNEIAEGIDAPRSFTAKILQQLNRKQVIFSLKGPTGGFYLTSKARMQPVWRVLQALDEDQRLTSCVMGLHKCNDRKPCPLHNQYKAIREPLVEMFKQRLISELADSMDKTKVFVKHQ
ncbi:MAG TPA: Rrf2 family transcriptional regulator [Flavisolibacter sp.]|nr:Rrf2 family transcriptional regulator [Flavisolibacter sp.]